MKSHTPGPWTVNGHYIESPPLRPNFGRRAVARVDYSHHSEIPANARLIAAAPELLAALKEAIATVDGFDHGDEGEDGDPIASWRAAVAKAEVNA